MKVDRFNPWEAGFVKRWHANPKMCDCGDSISSHSHRMSVLAIKLFGASKNLLTYIALHDLGEVGSGDVAYPFKRAEPEAYKVIEEYEGKVIEAMGFTMPKLTITEETQLWLLDRLDALLMMHRHKPHLINTGSWTKGQEEILKIASTLGVFFEVKDIIMEVRDCE